MDPVTVASAAAVTTVVKVAIDRGGKWIAERFKDHEERAVEAAQQNALSFLVNLDNRVQALEETGADMERINSAMGDPDLAATMQDAIVASARTSNADKHDILARAVTERLAAEPEGLVALASSLAIKAIPHLSPKHLNILGVCTFVFYIRPSTFPPDEVSPEDFGEWYVSWLRRMLAPLLDTELTAETLDYVHLMSVACVSYDTLGGRDLKKVLSPKDIEKYPWPAEEFFSEDLLGKKLSDLWQGGMEHVMLTTAGQLIGVYVKDQSTGVTTTVNW